MTQARTPNVLMDLEKCLSRCVSSHHQRKKTPVSPLLLVTSKKHTLVGRISPFEKITSKAFICKSTLPSFLKDEPSRRLRIIKTQAPIKQPSPMKLTNREGILSEIQSFLKNNRTDPQFLLRVCKFELTSEDLLTLRPHQEVSRLVVDACLKLIKKKITRKINKKKEPLERVFPLNSKTVKRLFTKHEEISDLSSKDLLKYEHIIFPFYSGYWVVLFCDLGRKIATLFDPIGIDNYKKTIKQSLSTFIKTNIKLEDTFVKNYFLRKLTYNFTTEYQIYDHFDSAIYILMQVEHHFLNRKLLISPETIQSFRTHLLYKLFKNGTKVSYS